MYYECVQIFVVTVYCIGVCSSDLAWLAAGGVREARRGEAQAKAGTDRKVQQRPTRLEPSIFRFVFVIPIDQDCFDPLRSLTSW